MGIDLAYMEGKIRAMRASGHPDHEIGYAIGYDCGRVVERDVFVAVIQSIGHDHADQIRYLQGCLLNTSRIGKMFAFGGTVGGVVWGFFLGWIFT